MRPGDLEERLATFAAELRWERLPGRVRARVRSLVLDAVASALAGRAASGLPAVERFAAALGDGASSVIGGGRLSTVGATLLNAHMTTAVTICDVYRPALCHVLPEVLPPAVAIAEREDATGGDLLEAVAAGVELVVRLGRGLAYPGFRARGWHSPGVIGPFGGATAVTRLLGGDLERMRDAHGLAGSQSAGTFAALGTPTIKFHQARGAVSGLLAGLLAAEGFASSHTILTDPDGGLLPAYAGGGDPAAALDGLGDSWELEQIGLRRWPVASSLQGLVGCVFDLLAAPGVDAAAVRRLDISLSTAGYALCGAMQPSDPLTAQQSASYVAAVVLLDGACWLEQFSAERIGDPGVLEFAAERTRVAIDEELPEAGVVLRAEVADQALEIRRELPKGDPADPLSHQEIREKFDAAARSSGWDAARVGAALDAVDALESTSSVRSVCDLLRDPS